ncbi:hypothetical protein Vretimale_18144 [Volvox reticuliferus]|uniref:Uncharacterized protein n=1 Tax=Volvox reticuliferus TaxID=1737510 RepID=A0A8J4LXW3_9CHLO|nr:hypothetical protein Vretifemale_17770 [Volvox reticuliferus]GIM15299.1 hypothetical protein Vretimale_18144 [Volvox reticuliferus]
MWTACCQETVTAGATLAVVTAEEGSIAALQNCLPLSRSLTKFMMFSLIHSKRTKLYEYRTCAAWLLLLLLVVVVVVVAVVLLQELSNMIYGLARLGLRMHGGAAAGNTPPPPSAATAPDSDGDSYGRSGRGDGAAAEEAVGLAGPAGEGRTSPSLSRPPVLPPPTLGSPAASSTSRSRSQSQLRSTSNEHSPQSPDALNWNGSFPLPEDPDTAARQFVVRLDKHVRQRLQPTCTRSGLRPFDPQSLSNITWALAVIGYADQSYFMIAIHAALYGGCMDDACPQEWVIFLWTWPAGHTDPLGSPASVAQPPVRRAPLDCRGPAEGLAYPALVPLHAGPVR